MDTVPSAAAARNNPPIGNYQREFGYTTWRVTGHGAAFAHGLSDVRVAAAAKRFPGLGRVTANPDTSFGVTDRVTVRHDPHFAQFQAAVDAGSQFMMVSTAFYSRIDGTRAAAFSPTVIKTLLRGDLKFNRVVISDDLGNARQIAAWTPAQRAVLFVQAGRDMILTVSPAVLPAMYNAVLKRATSDSAFRSAVNGAALRILTSKQHQGLIPAPTDTGSAARTDDCPRDQCRDSLAGTPFTWERSWLTASGPSSTPSATRLQLIWPPWGAMTGAPRPCAPDRPSIRCWPTR